MYYHICILWLFWIYSSPSGDILNRIMILLHGEKILPFFLPEIIIHDQVRQRRIKEVKKKHVNTSQSKRMFIPLTSNISLFIILLCHKTIFGNTALSDPQITQILIKCSVLIKLIQTYTPKFLKLLILTQNFHWTTKIIFLHL